MKKSIETIVLSNQTIIHAVIKFHLDNFPYGNHTLYQYNREVNLLTISERVY